MRQKGTVWQRPLVVGAAGQVGAELCRALVAEGAEEVLRSSRTSRPGWLSLDLSALASPQQAASLLDSCAPDLIVCAGAMTFVDGCEERPREAFLANAHGPSALASYARGRGIPFVLFSSDYVFDGTPEHAGPYLESAEPRPLSVYGESKLQGERAVQRVNPRALVVRTSWVYGPDAAGKNFISTLLRQLRAGKPVRVPVDQVSTPTFNRDLARATLDLLHAGADGVVHLCGSELMSRLELARAVAGFFGLPHDQVQGVETRSLGQRARRPLHSGLVSDRLAGLLPKLKLHTVVEALGETADLLQG